MSNEPLALILSKFNNQKKNSSGWQVNCPVHDDQKASLSISLANDGKVLLKCHAGCKTEEIISALDLEMKDLFPDNGYSSSNNNFDIEKTYDYNNEDGNLLYQVCRLKGKEFRQRRPDGNGGWIWNLTNVTPVPYRLPEIIKEGKSKTIIIVEGEKDANNLVKLGFVATCNSGGAGKWKPEFKKYFKSTKVVIISDNDTPGKKHAEKIARSLYGTAKEIRILELPGLPNKGDVSDFLENGGDRDKLIELAKKAPRWKPTAQVNEDIEFRRTEGGNSERMVYYFKNQIRYNFKPLNRWFIWESTRWALDNGNKVYEYSDKTVKRMYEEALQYDDESERSTLSKWAAQSDTAQKKKNMVFLTSTNQSIVIDIGNFDKHHWLLNTLNCTLDLSNGEIVEGEHNPNDYITKIAPVNYDPSSKCPKWIKFIDEIFNGDDELIVFVQRAVGYSLIGDTSEQCLFFCYGSGKNGKSVFLKTLEMLFGDYFYKAPNEMIIQNKNNTIPSDIAGMRGKRLVITSEIEDNRRLNESRIKDLTGGDRITARKLYGDWFDFDPTHKLWIYGNHKPAIHGDDKGIWRRLKIIPFTVTISDEKQVPMHYLLDSFSNELSGILNWALNGYLQHFERGLRVPDTVSKATSEYRSEMDVIGNFLNEHCIKDQNKSILSKILWNKYKEWANELGEHYVVSNRKFNNKLRERGFEVKPGTDNKTFVYGINLKQEVVN